MFNIYRIFFTSIDKAIFIVCDMLTISFIIHIISFRANFIIFEIGYFFTMYIMIFIIFLFFLTHDESISLLFYHLYKYLLHEGIGFFELPKVYLPVSILFPLIIFPLENFSSFMMGSFLTACVFPIPIVKNSSTFFICFFNSFSF